MLLMCPCPTETHPPISSPLDEDKEGDKVEEEGRPGIPPPMCTWMLDIWAKVTGSHTRTVPSATEAVASRSPVERAEEEEEAEAEEEAEEGRGV